MSFVLAILTVSFLPFTQSGIVTPTTTNATYEMYDTSMGFQDIVTCTKSYCEVICVGTSRCSSAQIDGSQANTLKLACSGSNACFGTDIAYGGKVSTIIDCTYETACTSNNFNLENSQLIHLNCNYSTAYNPSNINAACKSVELRTSSITSNINVHCDYFGCDGAKLYAQSITNSLHLDCTQAYSCKKAQVYCPLNNQCNIVCANKQNACSSMAIYVNNMTSDINLDCNAGSSVCGQSSIHCVSSSLSTALSYQVTNNEWICADTDCCPIGLFETPAPTATDPTINPTISPNTVSTTDSTTSSVSKMSSLSSSLSSSISSSMYASSTASNVTPITDPLATRKRQFGPELISLSHSYRTLTSTFFGLCVVIGFSAWIDSKYIRINDYFHIGAIASTTMQTLDMVSDCFFAIEVGIQNKIYLQSEYESILAASIIFILFPALMALFQLYFYAKKHWLKNDFIRSWITKYSTILLLLSVVTGSSFAAVSLLNSYIFQIELFDMGLTRKQLKQFNTKRVYSIVLVENLPQLCLQSYYVYLIGGTYNPIVITSIMFSIISIIVSILSMTMEKTIHYTQRYIVVSMDITGDCVTKRASKCRTMCTKLKKALGTRIGVDHHVIETVKPSYIQKGLSLKVYIYVNDEENNKKIDYKQVLIEADEKNELADIFKKSWKLDDNPTISNMNIDIIESKKQRHLSGISKGFERKSEDVESAENTTKQITDANNTKQDVLIENTLKQIELQSETQHKSSDQ